MELEAYFTFGLGMYNNGGRESLRNHYVKTTRSKLFAKTAGMFAFQYTWEQFEPQIKEYNLTEIKLHELENVVLL